MKCPKCQYLGFETGDRCRNCGYDFSLMATDEPKDPDHTGPVSPHAAAWDTFDRGETGALQVDPPLRKDPDASRDESSEPALPLFAVGAEEQPLVRLPVTPRRPLAVRRNAEPPRGARAAAHSGPPQVPEPVGPMPSEPEFDFPEEASVPTWTVPASDEAHRRPARAEPEGAVPGSRVVSSAGRRFMAAGIDYALLAGIDLAIIYFTVRMSGLEMGEWRLIPLVPLTLFLSVIALSYVGFFTAIGGQTIGKMVAHIRVVPDDPVPVGAVHAAKRTAAVAVSWLTGGLGFLPALVGDHRALHDRLSGTRVVDLG